ncbi:suppressor of fused domain protein [Myceligenerans crystallogenes]
MDVPPELGTLVRDGEEITFLMPTFLTAAELEFKLDEGTDALLDRLSAAGLSPVLDSGRPSTT